MLGGARLASWCTHVTVPTPLCLGPVRVSFPASVYFHLHSSLGAWA